MLVGQGEGRPFVLILVAREFYSRRLQQISVPLTQSDDVSLISCCKICSTSRTSMVWVGQSQRNPLSALLRNRLLVTERWRPRIGQTPEICSLGRHSLDGGALRILALLRKVTNCVHSPSPKSWRPSASSGRSLQRRATFQRSPRAWTSLFLRAHIDRKNHP
jgi:hypothetical protein